MPEPIESQRRPDPNEKLVKVFDSEQEPEALVVKGLLESGGIDSDLTSASLVQDAFPGLGGVIILVREEDEEIARKLIAEYRRPDSEQADSDQLDSESGPDDETAEYRITPEPPRKP